VDCLIVIRGLPRLLLTEPLAEQQVTEPLAEQQVLLRQVAKREVCVALVVAASRDGPVAGLVCVYLRALVGVSAPDLKTVFLLGIRRGIVIFVWK